ncbi:MAG TPA: hypothetical protein VE031_04040 [Chthoniobacterales bacterium]|nr:hypothetical protein [Chthoniobacterales bacterium]
MIAQGILRLGLSIAVCVWIGLVSAKADRSFAFSRDTFSFDNETALEFHDGQASPRPRRPGEQPKRFTQHCFVMSRTVMQFRKFVRFEPAQAPLEDKELADRIRKITRVPPWDAPFAEADRIVMPGYKDLRSLSEARPEILQKNIGLGWPTYFRPGNWRIVWPHGPSQQAQTHEELERRLRSPGGYFVAYLTNFPRSLNINHGVLVYARKPNDRTANGSYRYAVYDPNHHDAPRTLEWSERDRCFLYQHDTDFVGGRVIVWQVYGYPLQ